MGKHLALEPEKILIAYFSHTGRTQVTAKQIQGKIGGKLFKIVPANPYPNNYNQCVEQAKKELAAQLRPDLQTNVENMNGYDLVFIGYPNWWGTIPMPVATFLTSYDLSGATIAPFCTHGGGGIGRSVKDIIELCRQSTVLDGLAIRGGSVSSAQESVSRWLKEQEII